MKRIPWNVNIKPASNGVIVKVGCVELLYTGDTYKTLLADLDLYLKDHNEVIKVINKRWDLKMMEGPSVEQPVGSASSRARSVGIGTVSERSSRADTAETPVPAEEATER